MASKLGSGGSLIAIGFLAIFVFVILKMRKKVDKSNNSLAKGAMKVGDTFTMIRFIIFIPIILIIIFVIAKSKKQ